MEVFEKKGFYVQSGPSKIVSLPKEVLSAHAYDPQPTDRRLDPGEHHLEGPVGRGVYRDTSVDVPNFQLSFPDGSKIYDWRSGSERSPHFEDLSTLDKPTRIIFTKTKKGDLKETRFWLKGPVNAPRLIERQKELPSIETVVPKVNKTVRKYLKRRLSGEWKTIQTPEKQVSVLRRVMTPTKRLKYEDRFYGSTDSPENEDAPFARERTLNSSAERVIFVDPSAPGTPYTGFATHITRSDCTRYAAAQIENTCSFYATINIFLIVEALRNYAIRVMHGLIQEDASLAERLPRRYIRDSPTAFVASAVTRRVCFKYDDDFCTAGFVFASMFLGGPEAIVKQGKPGYALTNLVAMMSAVGLKGVINPWPEHVIPDDVTYVIQSVSGKSHVDFLNSATEAGFHLLQGNLSYGPYRLVAAMILLPDHAVVGVVCKDGTLLLHDQNFGEEKLNWLKYDELVSFYSRRYSPVTNPRISIHFMMLRSAFMRRQSRPVACGDVKDSVVVSPLFTKEEMMTMPRDYMRFTLSLGKNAARGILTAPISMLKTIKRVMA